MAVRILLRRPRGRVLVESSRHDEVTAGLLPLDNDVVVWG